MSYQRARLTLERSGGFAGLVITHTVDTDRLDPTRRSDYLALLDRLDLASTPSARIAHADQFQYDLHLELDGTRQLLHFSDQGQSPELVTLTRMITSDSHPT